MSYEISPLTDAELDELSSIEATPVEIRTLEVEVAAKIEAATNEEASRGWVRSRLTGDQVVFAARARSARSRKV